MSTLEPLPGDLYGYVGELSAAEQEILGRVRRFADERIAKGFVVEKGTPGFTAEKMEGKSPAPARSWGATACCCRSTRWSSGAP